MGNLCCSDKEGKLSYVIDANNHLVGRIKVKIDRNFLKENNIEPPKKVNIMLPRSMQSSFSPEKRGRKMKLQVDKVEDNHITYK